MQTMSAADLAKLWKEYVWQLSQILAKEDDFQGTWTRSSERLDALTSELVQLMMHLWDCCPEFARIKARLQKSKSGKHSYLDLNLKPLVPNLPSLPESVSGRVLHVRLAIWGAVSLHGG